MIRWRSSFSPLCLTEADIKEYVEEPIKHAVNSEDTNKLLLPIYNKDNNHIFLTAFFVTTHGELDPKLKKLYCFSLDPFLSTMESSVDISSRVTI